MNFEGVVAKSKYYLKTFNDTDEVTYTSSKRLKNLKGDSFESDPIDSELKGFNDPQEYKLATQEQQNVEFVKTELEKLHDTITSLKNEVLLYKKALFCSICDDFFVKPYYLPCGHSFCGLCLLKVLEEEKATATLQRCRLCQAPVLAYPVPSHSLESQLEIMIEGFPEERRCEYLYKQLSATQPLNNLKWENVIPLTDLKKRTFIYDSSESIFRCGTCKSEVVRGECSSCHFKYPQLIDVTNASESILETEESLSEDLETEGDTSDSFINDNDL